MQQAITAADQKRNNLALQLIPEAARMSAQAKNTPSLLDLVHQASWCTVLLQVLHKAEKRGNVPQLTREWPLCTATTSQVVHNCLNGSTAEQRVAITLSCPAALLLIVGFLSLGMRPTMLQLAGFPAVPAGCKVEHGAPHALQGSL